MRSPTSLVALPKSTPLGKQGGGIAHTRHRVPGPRRPHGGPTALLAWDSDARAYPIALFGVIAMSLAGCGLTRSPTLQGLLAVGVGLTFMALFFLCFLAWAGAAPEH